MTYYKLYEEAICKLDRNEITLGEFDAMIKPLHDEVRPTGHWIDADGDNAICSCCNRLNHLYGDYCKHCGARMVESQEGANDEN